MLFYFKLIYVISSYTSGYIQGHYVLCYYKLFYSNYKNLK